MHRSSPPLSWPTQHALIAILVIGWSSSVQAQFTTTEPAQIRGDTIATSNGWSTQPLITIGEETAGGADFNLANLGYRPPGVLDGLGAYVLDADTLRVFANHEFGAGDGYDYMLANGTILDGSRISYIDIDRTTRQVLGGGLALRRIFDRAGSEVTSAGQLDHGGLERFCSGTLHEPEAFGAGRGFEDRLFLTCEESSSSFGGPGGSYWVLDVATGDLFALRDMGRGSFENAALLDTGRTDQVALLLGDDHGASSSTQTTNPAPPLYLYVGTKLPAGNFPERNGLVGGQLYVWVTDGGETSPATFNGTGSSRPGHWVVITGNFDLANAGMDSDGNPNTGDFGIDYTADGYAVDSTLRLEAVSLGAFQFSRPEDLATDPNDGTRAIMASTGRSSLFGGADRWGMVYLIEVDFVFDGGGTFDPAASLTTLTILNDGDALAIPQLGLRNPDNLTWSPSGLIYVQEDDTSGFSGVEASVWQLDPATFVIERMLEMDRSAVPLGQTDTDSFDTGDWESSGIIDVTVFFDTAPDETLLLLTVQAHHLRNGGVGGSGDLVQGGQLLFASKIADTDGPGQAICFGVGCPCGNDDPAAGCVNSTGAGALLIATGSTSVAADDLVLLATNCPPNNSGLFFAADTQFLPPVDVGDGLGCAGGSSFRYFPAVVDAMGGFTRATPVASAPPGFIQPGDTRFFQAWTRDVLCGPPPSPCPSPCGMNNNLTNSYEVVFQP